MLRVAVAALTAGTAGHVPGVGRTAVTVLTNHVGSAMALAAAAVAVAVGGGLAAGLVAAQLIADTLCDHKAELWTVYQQLNNLLAKFSIFKNTLCIFNFTSWLSDFWLQSQFPNKN